MKFLTLAILSTVVFAVSAKDQVFTAEQAQAKVIQAAHRYIANNAPDFGGSVHSPCTTALRGDSYTVKCSGIADVTMPGDGDNKEHFNCTGSFIQGHDGLFAQDGRISCK